jgi:hypothetical protein
MRKTILNLHFSPRKAWKFVQFGRCSMPPATCHLLPMLTQGLCTCTRQTLIQNKWPKKGLGLYQGPTALFPSAAAVAVILRTCQGTPRSLLLNSNPIRRKSGVLHVQRPSSQDRL